MNTNYVFHFFLKEPRNLKQPSYSFENEIIANQNKDISGIGYI